MCIFDYSVMPTIDLYFNFKALLIHIINDYLVIKQRNERRFLIIKDYV